MSAALLCIPMIPKNVSVVNFFINIQGFARLIFHALGSLTLVVPFFIPLVVALHRLKITKRRYFSEVFSFLLFINIMIPGIYGDDFYSTHQNVFAVLFFILGVGIIALVGSFIYKSKKM